MIVFTLPFKVELVLSSIYILNLFHRFIVLQFKKGILKIFMISFKIFYNFLAGFVLAEALTKKYRPSIIIWIIEKHRPEEARQSSVMYPVKIIQHNENATFY